MDKNLVIDLLSGFFAWDAKATDSGINDPIKRNKLAIYLGDLHCSNEVQFTDIMFEYVIRNMICNNARKEGYTYTDLQQFVEWFKEFMADEARCDL